MIEKSLFPLDKLNTQVAWNQAEGKDVFEAEVGVLRKGQAPFVVYQLDFTRYKGSMSRTLNHFDERVYLALSSLYQAGQHQVSLTRINEAMGKGNKPYPEALRRIEASLRKMAAASVSLSTRDVAAKSDYPFIEITTNLLPISIKTLYTADEKIIESQISINAMPPLMDFALQFRQYTRLPLSVLQTPLRVTENNLKSEDYILQLIARAKNGDKQRIKMKLETFYERTGAASKKQRYDARAAAAKLLTRYKACGWIKGFTVRQSEFEISLR